MTAWKVHGSLSVVMHSPFMRQCWGLPHRLAQCMSQQGWGKLVALHCSLMRRVWVLCYATLLSSELVSPACVQARSSNPRGRAFRPNGKGSGEEGILSDVDKLYLFLFILPGLKLVFLQASNPGMHDYRLPSHSAHLAPSVQAELSVWTGPIGSPPTCSPAPSVIAD